MRSGVITVARVAAPRFGKTSPFPTTRDVGKPVALVALTNVVIVLAHRGLDITDVPVNSPIARVLKTLAPTPLRRHPLATHLPESLAVVETVALIHGITVSPDFRLTIGCVTQGQTCQQYQ